jgi:hypothetical protein
MHRDHDVFIRSVERETKVKLIYFNSKHRRKVSSLCAPLHFSKSMTGQEEQDCYYLWDFEAEKGSNFLPLSPSQIVGIELTDEAFDTQDFHTLSNTAEKPTKELKAGG